ncbi:uncharacterized protein LOC135834268 [Planococcus citri]|uniref:uncharacterized protein LOC135834268 n=1 Tax=Planococcus citri TaxID=170843 RepID=UPI0031F7E127
MPDSPPAHGEGDDEIQVISTKPDFYNRFYQGFMETMQEDASLEELERQITRRGMEVPNNSETRMDTTSPPQSNNDDPAGKKSTTSPNEDVKMLKRTKKAMVPLSCKRKRLAAKLLKQEAKHLAKAAYYRNEYEKLEKLPLIPDIEIDDS